MSWGNSREDQGNSQGNLEREISMNYLEGNCQGDLFGAKINSRANKYAINQRPFQTIIQTFYLNARFLKRFFKRVLPNYTSQVLICCKVFKKFKFLVVFMMQNTGCYTTRSQVPLDAPTRCKCTMDHSSLTWKMNKSKEMSGRLAS